MGGANARSPEYGGMGHAEMGVDFLSDLDRRGVSSASPALRAGRRQIAKVLFFLFLVIFIIVLILAITAGEIIL